MNKPIYGIDFEKESLTLDGFEIERPDFEKKGEEVEKIPIDFAPYGNINVVANDKENELPSWDDFGESCEEANCLRPGNSYYHTMFWARL